MDGHPDCNSSSCYDFCCMTTKKRCFFPEIDAPDLNDFAVKRQETSTGFLLAFFLADFDYELLVD